VATPVPQLAAVLRQALASPGVVVEHVYDY